MQDGVLTFAMLRDTLIVLGHPQGCPFFLTLVAVCPGEGIKEEGNVGREKCQNHKDTANEQNQRESKLARLCAFLKALRFIVKGNTCGQEEDGNV